MYGRILSLSDMLYMKFPSEVIRSLALRELIRVKLSETSTELIYKEKLVTGLLPSKLGVHWIATQRAPCSSKLRLIGESGGSIV